MLTGRPRRREPYARLKRQVAVEEVIGQLIGIHGLTDAMRLQCVHIYWPEIVGAKWAAHTVPDTVSDDVLRIGVRTSSWMHELRFHKQKIIERIDGWFSTYHTMLGAAPFARDLHFVLDRPRATAADPEHARRLFQRHLRRLRPRSAIVPPVASDAERAAIIAETCIVEDPEVRKAIEDIRLKWNC